MNLSCLKSMPPQFRERSSRPLAIELFCGCFGWSRGWLAMGGRVIGFDIEHLPHHGAVPDGAELVLQDVLTLHGSRFRNAAVIFASPPCQKYSYLAMPWSRSKPTGECIKCRGTGLNPPGKSAEAICLVCEGSGVIENYKAAKALRKEWETNGPDNRLFDACFRIQREAIEATQKTCKICLGGKDDPWTGYTCSECGGLGWTERRYIPLIVENVRGAVPWVGPQKANFGSFYLWGDIAQVGKRIMRADAGFGASGLAGNHVKAPGQDWNRFRLHGEVSPDWKMQNTNHKSDKDSGGWFNDYKGEHCVGISRTGSKSPERKRASAAAAMIPPALSDYVAEMFWPERTAA